MQKVGDMGDLELLKAALKKTFSKIKEDITVNSDEINTLKGSIDSFSTELKQIKLILDNINSSIDKQNKQQNFNQSQQQSTQQPIQQVQSIQNTQQLQQIQPIQQNIGLRAEMMRRLKRNKRSVIKQKILNIISSGQYTLPEIKDIVVDENNYCSKASFYRYFEELKKRELVDLIEINDVKIIMIKSQTSLRLN